MENTKYRKKRFSFFSILIAGTLLTLSSQEASASLTTSCDIFEQASCMSSEPAKKKRLNRGFRSRGLLRHRNHRSKKSRRHRSSHVKTHCFPQRLRNLIHQVENHYGKKLTLISGYRSPSYNRRVGGAKRSQHMHCKAVDFSVRGVNKYSLARYVKSLNSVGGVGTYCKSAYIHMDVGPKRSWNWGCGKHHKSRTYAKHHKHHRSHKRRYRRKARRSYRTASYRHKRRNTAKKWSYKF